MEVINVAFHNLLEFINSAETLKIVMANRFFLILFVLILSSIKHSSYTGMWATTLINIPGTLLHECAHFLVGMVLNAHPTSFTLFPKKSGNVYVMGSVGFKNLTFYNSLPSAMAPLLLLPIGFYFNRYFFSNVNVNIYKYTMYILLQSIIIENALPSSTDFKVGFRNIQGVILYGAIIVIYLAFFI